MCICIHDLTTNKHIPNDIRRRWSGDRRLTIPTFSLLLRIPPCHVRVCVNDGDRVTVGMGIYEYVYNRLDLGSQTASRDSVLD